MNTNPTILIPSSQGKENDPYGYEGNNPNHTVIQDMGATNQSAPNPNLRKLVGFLVSYSRIEEGEYWPLYLGKNEIGSVSESNVILREHKVSGTHAIINIRRAKLPKSNEVKLVYAINDNNSTNGTIVNGEDLVFEGGQRLLNQSDMIDIGNYHLMLICIDTIALDLSTNPDFVSLDSIDEEIPDYDKPNSTRVYQ